MDEGMLAEITLFGGNFAPVGWEFCKGQVLPIESNQALFSLLGTQYGGDGMRTFSLPNLAPLTSTGAGEINYIICVNGIYPQHP